MMRKCRNGWGMFFGCALLILVPGTIVWAQPVPVLWQDLAGHIAGMDLESPDHFMDCPAALDENAPHTTVLQWIEYTRYQWREYALGEAACIVMEMPESRPLTRDEAQVLLKASSLWMMPAKVQPEATVGVQLTGRTPAPVPDSVGVTAYLQGFGENESVISPVMPSEDPEGQGELQSVIGTDDRILVSNTQTYPFNTIAYVTMSHQGQYYRGTAFLVSPYVALTNAHNVFDYDSGTWMENVGVYPGQYESGYGSVIRPYSGRTGYQYIIPSWYKDYGDLGDDYAAIRFDTPFPGISTFMPLQFGYDIDNTTTMLHSAGYPAVVHGSDTFAQWYDSGHSSSLTTWDIARYYMDVTGGSSGSPVWCFVQASRYVVALNAAGWAWGLPNGGPRLGFHNQSLITSWVAWTPQPPAPPVPDVSGSDPISFDAGFYLGVYPDLSAAGLTPDTAWQHWQAHGIHEARQGSFVFDVLFYLSRYPDVQQVYGSNFPAAHGHWIAHGSHEGRQGAAAFDVRSYLLRYPDLQAAFAGDYSAAIRHWLSHGMAEGRVGAP